MYKCTLLDIFVINLQELASIDFNNLILFRVFKTMFKDGVAHSRICSPSGRRRLNSSGARVNTSVSSPQLQRKTNGFQPSPQKAKLISSVIVKKKKTSPDVMDRAASSSPEPRLPFLEEPRQIIQEQVRYLIR